MNTNYHPNKRRKRLRRALDRLHDELARKRPRDQIQRANHVNLAKEISREAAALGDDAASSRANRLFACAIHAAYAPGFCDAYLRLKCGDTADIVLILQFLENDPWFHRSGYVKANLLTFLKRVSVPDRYRQRFEQVLLGAVDSSDRREFRHYCRFARSLRSPALQAGLARRLSSPHSGIRRRAGWIQAALGKNRDKCG